MKSLSRAEYFRLRSLPTAECLRLALIVEEERFEVTLGLCERALVRLRKVSPGPRELANKLEGPASSPPSVSGGMLTVRWLEERAGRSPWGTSRLLAGDGSVSVEDSRSGGTELVVFAGGGDVQFEETDELR